MEITIENLQRKIALDLHQIKKITKTILESEGIQPLSLNIIFVSCQKIRALNRKYLNKDYATDVLAFDISDKNFLPEVLHSTSYIVKARNPASGKCLPVQAYMIADIFISTDAALKNMRRYNTTLEKELILYIIHGILHLAGYDDKHPDDIKKMRKREQELLGVVASAGSFAKKA